MSRQFPIRMFLAYYSAWNAQKAIW